MELNNATDMWNRKDRKARVRTSMNLAGTHILSRLPVLAVVCVLMSIATETLATAEPLGAVDGIIATDSQQNNKLVPVPEPSEKTLRFYHSGNVLWFVKTFWALFVPALILFTGFSARLRNWARAIGRKWFFVISVYVALYLVVEYILDFPLSYYLGFVRPHEYGLSNQSFGQWFGDSLKMLMVVVVMGMLFLWVPYLLLKKSPRRWWLYTSVAAVPFLALAMLVQPVLIGPLFDDYGPMKDKALETEILQLADRAGIDGGRVFEVNKSEDTETMNAYVVGLLDTKRIVLWNTLTNKLDREQVLAVMGHEMGHYVLGHIWKLLVLLSALIVAALYAVHRTLNFLIRRYQHRFGFSEASDVASLPLLLLLFTLFSLALRPVGFAYTRQAERDCDRFGLEITQNNYAMASALAALQDENLSHPRPGPLYVLWRSWHPPIAERIEFVNSYRPWETGQPLTYGEYFREP